MPVNLVWFKRDLRLTDHQPLKRAIDAGLPVVLIYIFEPSLISAPQSDVRHWRFVWQSITDLNNQLKDYDVQIIPIHGEVLEVLNNLQSQLPIQSIYSHQETGLQITYDRDLAIAKWCEVNGVDWHESQYAGVTRGRSNRKNWRKEWYTYMGKPLEHPDLKKAEVVPKVDLSNFQPLPEDILTEKERFQKGGPSLARKYLRTFLDERAKQYNTNISKPAASRKSCSRLSPYIAWGNLSMREVYQAMKAKKDEVTYKKHLSSFGSRLRWHCHFIQKYEMEIRYESENINRGYDAIRTEWDEKKYLAWEQGQTGYPLVDACMRCVKATGYLNFRMRAMVVSFLTHHLWLDWKRGADYLAKQFLDFEPGIHYPQFQMQAGTTGINTIRIYNPVKQSKDNDPDAVFIKTWVPELVDLPVNFALEPWTLTEAEQLMYGFQLGQDYPKPIVDIKQTYKAATSQLYKMKGSKEVRKEAGRILKKHTVERRKV